MPSAQIGTYQAVQTTTADPERLVLLLFDGATMFLRRARQGLDRGNVPVFTHSLSRAHAIIAELSNALDREAGGEIVDNLARLYDFLLRHLTQGLVARSMRHLDQALAILGTLREGFEAAVERKPA